MPLTWFATCKNAFTCSMRAAWAGLSFLPAMSIPRRERLGQHATVEQGQGRNAEEARQRRRDIDGVRPPPVASGPDPPTPQHQRHVAVELRRLTVSSATAWASGCLCARAYAVKGVTP